MIQGKRVRMAGCPYHGTVEGGQLALPNSQVITYAQPTAGSTQYLQAPGATAPVRDAVGQAADTANGWQWRADAMLSGRARQVCGQSLGGSRTTNYLSVGGLYWDDAGVCWRMTAQLWADTGRVKLTLVRRFGAMSLTAPADYPTENAVLLDVTYGVPAGFGTGVVTHYDEIQQSSDGSKWAFCINDSGGVRRIVEVTLTGSYGGAPALSAVGAIVHDGAALFDVATTPVADSTVSSYVSLTWNSDETVETTGVCGVDTVVVESTRTRAGSFAASTGGGLNFPAPSGNAGGSVTVSVQTLGAFYDDTGALVLMQSRLTVTVNTLHTILSVTGSTTVVDYCYRADPCTDWDTTTRTETTSFNRTREQLTTRTYLNELLVGGLVVDSETVTVTQTIHSDDTVVNNNSGVAMPVGGCGFGSDTYTETDVQTTTVTHSHEATDNFVDVVTPVTPRATMLITGSTLSGAGPSRFNTADVDRETNCIGSLQADLAIDALRMYGPGGATYSGAWRFSTFDWFGGQIKTSAAPVCAV